MKRASEYQIELEEAWENFKLNGDEEAKAFLMNHYVPLVEKIASSMVKKLPKTVEYGDLVNDGFFGLVQAIERFDDSMGFKFETYASNRIRGEISDRLRDNDWVSRYSRLKFKLVHQTRDALLEELQRFPTDREIAERIGWEEEDVQSVQAAFGRTYPENINEKMAESDHEVFTIEDIVADNSLGDPVFNLTLSEMTDDMLRGLKELTQNESKVVFLSHYENLTFSEIAEVLGVNPSRVSQIYYSALQKLKEVFFE